MLALTKTRLAWTWTVLASTAFLGCGDDFSEPPPPSSHLPAEPEASDECTAIAEDPTKPQFSYDRTDPSRGPSAWGRILVPDGTLAYPACADATAQQSPIALPSPEMPWVVGGMALDPKTLSWSDEVPIASTLNNGHTWLAAVAPTQENTLTYQGEPFALQQFHMHTPSEHTVGGKSFPMEMHFVHRGGNNAFAAVVALLFEESKDDNPELEKVWPLFSICPAAESTPVQDVTIDLRALLPENTSHFEYDGSLTTPPCTRTVHWFVVTEPIHASAAQINAFADVFGPSNRPTQPVLDEQSVTYELQN